MLLFLRRGVSGVWNRIMSMDRAVLLWFHGIEKRWLAKWMLTATRLGDTSTWIAMGLLLWAAGDGVKWEFYLLATAALSASVISQLVKHVCRRERPRVAIANFSARVEMPDPYSFPSGHTATAFAVAIALLPEGAWLGPLTLFHAFSVAASRVYLGAHYPLDVTAGAALGIAVGLLTRVVVLT